MRGAIAGIVVIIFFGLWFFLAQRAEDDPAPPTPEEQVESIVKTPAEPRRPVLADTMLANYGTDESSGKEDFRKLTTFLDSVFLLVKKRDTADYATNEDLALFLKGSNPHQTAFLSADSPALNKEGQDHPQRRLVERTGSVDAGNARGTPEGDEGEGSRHRGGRHQRKRLGI